MKEYLIKPGLLDRQRKLILTADYLAWENRDLKGNEFTRLNKADIADFKHGVDWMVWYKFTVGRRFSITFKDKRNRELKIEFQSHLGLNKDNNQKYLEIVDDIWKYYHSDIVDRYLDKFYSSGEIEIQGIGLAKDGIKLPAPMGRIAWDKVATKEYYRYFAIYDKDNSDIHSRVAYNEFGTEVLWSSIKTILKEMNASQQEL